MRTDPDLFKMLEKIITIWYKKIELVLEEANLVRAESDSWGPRHELDYWRSLLTKFNTIMDFLESESVGLFLKAVEPSRSIYVLVSFLFLVFFHHVYHKFDLERNGSRFPSEQKLHEMKRKTMCSIWMNLTN